MTAPLSRPRGGTISNWWCGRPPRRTPRPARRRCIRSTSGRGGVLPVSYLYSKVYAVIELRDQLHDFRHLPLLHQGSRCAVIEQLLRGVQPQTRLLRREKVRELVGNVLELEDLPLRTRMRQRLPLIPPRYRLCLRLQNVCDLSRPKRCLFSNRLELLRDCAIAHGRSSWQNLRCNHAVCLDRFKCESSFYPRFI